MKQPQPKSDTKHDRKVLICGYTQEEDCLCVATDTIGSTYYESEDSIALEGTTISNPILPTDEAKPVQEGFTICKHSNPLNEDVDKFKVDKTNSLHQSGLSLVGNIMIKEFCANENGLPDEGKVFEESLERELGYKWQPNAKGIVEIQPPTDHIASEIKIEQVSGIGTHGELFKINDRNRVYNNSKITNVDRFFEGVHLVPYVEDFSIICGDMKSPVSIPSENELVFDVAVVSSTINMFTKCEKINFTIQVFNKNVSEEEPQPTILNSVVDSTVENYFNLNSWYKGVYGAQIAPKPPTRVRIQVVYKMFEERPKGGVELNFSQGIWTEVSLSPAMYSCWGNSKEEYSETTSNNFAIDYYVDQKFDLLQYGCSIKGKCDMIIIIAPAKQKEEQVFEWIAGVIKEVLSHGIQNIIVIYFDRPHTFEDEYGGGCNTKEVRDFNTYVDVCLKELTTSNDANMLTMTGYGMGIMATSCQSFLLCLGCTKEWQISICKENFQFCRMHVILIFTMTCPYRIIVLCFLEKFNKWKKKWWEFKPKHMDKVLFYKMDKFYEYLGNEYKAYVVAAKLYNQISKPTQKGEICISLMTRWWFEPNGNTQLDTSATEKAFGFLFGWLLGSLKHYGPLIMKTIVKDGPPTFSETEEFLVMQIHDDSHRLLLKLFFYKMKWQQLLFDVQNFLKVHSTISLVKLATYKEVNSEGKVISNISHFDFSIDDDKKEVAKFKMSKWNIGTTGKAYLRRFASMFVTLKKGIIFDPGGILFLTTTGKCKSTLKCPLEDNEVINKWGDEVINELDSNDTIKELGATCTRGNSVDVSLGMNGSKLKYNIEMLVAPKNYTSCQASKEDVNAASSLPLALLGNIQGVFMVLHYPLEQELCLVGHLGKELQITTCNCTGWIPLVQPAVWNDSSVLLESIGATPLLQMYLVMMSIQVVVSNIFHLEDKVDFEGMVMLRIYIYINK